MGGVKFLILNSHLVPLTTSFQPQAIQEPLATNHSLAYKGPLGLLEVPAILGAVGLEGAYMFLMLQEV